jgi:serine protease AprX
MARNSSGNRGDVRQSALWGSGNRGGELRSNALWGNKNGGRGVVVLMLVALSMPLAAAGGDNSGKGKSVDRQELITLGPLSVSTGGSANSGSGSMAEPVKGTHIAPGLLKKAKDSPDEKIRVIIQSKSGVDGAEKAGRGLGKLKHKLGLIDAVAMELDAKEIRKLAKVPGLTVTVDEPTRPHGYSSKQLWPHEAGINKLWDGPQAPTIAIVDSGIDANRLDFESRVLTQVDFVSSGNQNSPGDGRGHGTFVAGIAAGSAPGYAGAAPNAKLVSLDVMDDSGSGLTSDVIKASEWILANKAKYNIRVANFSLHSGNISRFYEDPLNLAINKLWFNGIVVVAAAGNYGKPDGPSGVPHSPGNNPFVITVGAVDIGGSHKLKDDSQAPWSAYGRTPDGFWKPEVCAAGRYMIGPIPDSSTLAIAKAENKQAPGYIELSGTSFAAPIVSGLAAQLLARNPQFTPDQVKGAVMASTRDVPEAAPNACGVGQVNGIKTGLATRAANPNAALNQFLVQAPDGSGPMFDAVSWSNVSWSNVSWSNVSWSNVSWSEVSWDAVSWSNVSWSNVSWSNVSWSNASSEDNADGEVAGADPYILTAEDAAAAALDPDLLAPGETLPIVIVGDVTSAETDAAEDAAAATETVTAATEDATSAVTSTAPSTLP